MDAAVKQVLDLFESLSDAQKSEAAVAILSRFPAEEGDLPDEAFTAMAEELLSALDEKERKSEQG